ncbi:MAG: methyltransferase type 11 [Nevskia sp.]|nr:methyltransferase type 11 [Nevskia sp.]
MNAVVQPRSAAQLTEFNRSFYDTLWSQSRLIAPERFNTWPLVQQLAVPSRRWLEIAPGMRPRLPLDDTLFVDLSRAAIATLQAHQARAVLGLATALPCADAAFDFVCAFDIVEHVDDDRRALAELARVAAPGAALLLSVPLHPQRWHAFDDFVGHRRRYAPAALQSLLAEFGFVIEQSAVYGMQPKSNWLLDLGTWFLTHQRDRAMWWYNRVLPLGVRFQSKLELVAGMIDTAGVDEILLVCRKQAAGT